jgi:hypothetical protein
VGVYSSTVVNTSSPPIPIPTSSKRSLNERDNVPPKRMRMSDNPPSGFTSAKDLHAGTSTRPAPGIMARVDSAAVKQGQSKFQREVVNPILHAMSRLEQGCIICICMGRPDWDHHHYEYCVKPEMNYGTDHDFVQFKKGFQIIRGFCFSCGLNTVRSFSFYL